MASPGIQQHPLRWGEGLEGTLTHEVNVQLGRLRPNVTQEAGAEPGLRAGILMPIFPSSHLAGPREPLTE